MSPRRNEGAKLPPEWWEFVKDLGKGSGKGFGCGHAVLIVLAGMVLYQCAVGDAPSNPEMPTVPSMTDAEKRTRLDDCNKGLVTAKRIGLIKRPLAMAGWTWMKFSGCSLIGNPRSASSSVLQLWKAAAIAQAMAGLAQALDLLVEARTLLRG